jgi:hypothetical protein
MTSPLYCHEVFEDSPGDDAPTSAYIVGCADTAARQWQHPCYVLHSPLENIAVFYDKSETALSNLVNICMQGQYAPVLFVPYSVWMCDPSFRTNTLELLHVLSITLDEPLYEIMRKQACYVDGVGDVVVDLPKPLSMRLAALKPKFERTPTRVPPSHAASPILKGNHPRPQRPRRRVVFSFQNTGQQNTQPQPPPPPVALSQEDCMVWRIVLFEDYVDSGSSARGVYSAAYFQMSAAIMGLHTLVADTRFPDIAASVTASYRSGLTEWVRVQ